MTNSFSEFVYHYAKYKCTLAFLVLFTTFVKGQQVPAEVEKSRLPVLQMHPQPEYTFDKPVNKEAWQGQKAGLHVSFGSTDQAYFRTEVPMQQEIRTWEATGWRGERVNAELLVWSPDTLHQVWLNLEDLKNEKGNILSKRYINCNLVRYVLSNYPYGARDAVCGDSPYKDGYLLPDRFDELDRFDLPGHTTRPIWLSLNIPATTEPGTYKGTITVISENQETKLQLSIHVQNQVLPPPHDWTYRLDLWQNPWVVAWYNHVKPWSEAHKMLLKKHLQLYADAGGKYITTYAVHSPWADNSYMIEGGMIDWIRKKDGGWKFDYTIFDTYVQLAMSVGIDKAITIYTAIPWGDRFRVKDEATGNYAYEIWPTESKKYSNMWTIFLTDLQTHLQEKGWFDKTYIGINETEMSHTLAAINVIKKHNKKWKITYAGDWHEQLDSLLDDYSFLYGKEPNLKQIKERAQRGATSTFYVCCNPPYPNNFVFSPPIEGRWMSWYAYAMGYNGFLRWAYDAWVEDPVRDARFGSWPAGDCFMVYPGAHSCVRFEKIREGISDYEKIRILKEQVAKSSDKSIRDLWNAFEKHLDTFTTEHEFNTSKITVEVNTCQALLNELSEKLSIERVL